MKKKALYYERVSTHHEDQDESMENQRALAQSYLKRHPEIELAEPLDTYSERESGKSDVRPKYQELLSRLEQGDIRFVLVKDFKRINRSTELSAQLRNHAKEYGYEFILLSTGQVFNPNADQNRMIYGFESLLNEEVVYRQSEYGRIAHRQKCEAKRLNRNNITFGYKWDSEAKEIVVDSEQAEVVRAIYEKYVFYDYGVQEIRKYLIEIGYSYSVNTISKWLQETAYIGIFHLNKKGSELGVGAGKKTKRFFNPKDEWIPVERPELAIIDRELFDLAQRIRESRIRHFDSNRKGEGVKISKQSRFKGKHIFSSKIYCAECGYPYVHGYADRKQTEGIYKDTYNIRTKTPSEKCPNEKYRRISEKDLVRLVSSIVNKLIDEQKDSIPILLNTISKVLEDDNSHQLSIAGKQKELMRLENVATNLMSKFEYASGPLLSDLNEKYNATHDKIASLKKEIDELSRKKEKDADISSQIKEIQEKIAKWCRIDPAKIDRKTVDAFVEKITINKEGLVNILLKTNSTVSAGYINERGKGDKNPSPFLYSNPAIQKKIGRHPMPIMQFGFFDSKNQSMEVEVSVDIYTNEQEDVL